MRVRAAVLAGQTDQRRLVRTPPGEVVARAMDADRIARYTDRWVDFVNGLLVAALTALIAGTWLAGAVLLAVMMASALASSLGPPRRRSVGGRRVGRARAVRSVAGVRARVRSARSSSPPPRPTSTATSARSTAGASTPRCASTACSRCSTACPS